MTVVVWDQLPGTGKSSRMIERINESDKDERFIVVAPFLSECHRYAGTLIDPASGDKQLPLRDDKGEVVYTGTGCSASGRRFVHPAKGFKNKVEHIAELVYRGQDVVTTHAALKLFTPETLKFIKDAGYTLIIDEELECIRPVFVKEHRRSMLLNSNVVYVDEHGLLRWNPDVKVEETEDSLDANGFSWEMQIKAMCDNGSLVLVQDEEGRRQLFMWEYPIEFIRAFDRVEVLTYLFNGSMFHRYLQLYGIPCTINTGVKYPDDPLSLITVVDNYKMNRVGERENSFSATHQKQLAQNKGSAVAQTIKKNLHNFFNSNTYGKAKGNEKLWTCLAEAKGCFKGAGYTTRHLAHNAKAVNDYRDTHLLAYIYNVYMQPEQYKYMFNKGEEFAPDADRYALSELLQWVYRSRVRKGEEITLYIPSSRMRELLLKWMEKDY